jgi:exosortase
MDITTQTDWAHRDQREAGRKALYYLPFVALLGLAAVLYYGTASWWWYEWTYPGSYYAHALFVPFFVAIMIWRNRERLSGLRWQPSWSGLVLLLPGLLLLLLSERAGVAAVKSISFILVLIGLTLLLLGPAKTRLLLFPLLFLMMMMPLVPDQLINGIAFPIQIASAHLATRMLNLITLRSVCEGTQIHMEHYKMAVELPCSGFKTLVSLLTFSAAFAYLVEGPTWKRWTLFLAAAPLSLVINALRIAFIGIVGELISTPAAQTFHDYSGFIVLILAFTFLFNFARLLRCERFLGMPLNEAEERRDRQARAQNAPSAEPAWWQIVLRWRPTQAQLRRAGRYALTADLLLLAALGVEGAVIRRSAPHPAIATTQVPQRFGAAGVSYSVSAVDTEIDRLSKEMEEDLNPLRIINRDYEGSDGSHIQFFLTAGNGRKVFHDPHTCSIGSDAVLRDVGIVEIPTRLGTIRMQESVFHHSGSATEYEVMFCYFVEGRVVQRTEQVRNAMISQMIFGDSGQPSYFFRAFQEAPGTGEAQRRPLIRFIAGMLDLIGPILSLRQPGLPEPPPRPYTHPQG